MDTGRKEADQLADAAALSATRIAAALRIKLLGLLADHSFREPITLAAELENLILRSADPIEATLYNQTVAAYVTGSGRVILPLASPSPELAAALPPILPPINVDPRLILFPGGVPSLEFPIINEAVETLRTSGILSPDIFYSLAAAARHDAFTITADVTTATLDDVREILREVTEDNGSRQAFADRVREELPGFKISDAHLEQVFRNNTNAKYSDGGEAVLNDPIISDAFPYRAYYPIRDDRARKTHLALEKMGLSRTNVFHKNDPVWTMFRPPWDWNCRCGWNALTIRQAARKGVAVAQQWLETGIEPRDQFVVFPKFRPSPSWQRIHVGQAV